MPISVVEDGEGRDATAADRTVCVRLGWKRERYERKGFDSQLRESAQRMACRQQDFIRKRMRSRAGST
jgi:hypothetical protein